MAEKKAAKKKAPAKPKAVEIPPNKEKMGAVVRTIQCDKKRASELVKKFGFFVMNEAEGEYTVCADQEANDKYEAEL